MNDNNTENRNRQIQVISGNQKCKYFFNGEEILFHKGGKKSEGSHIILKPNFHESHDQSCDIIMITGDDVVFEVAPFNMFFFFFGYCYFVSSERLHPLCYLIESELKIMSLMMCH